MSRPWGGTLAVQVLEEFADVARCIPRNDTGEIADTVLAAREAHRDYMRARRADPACRSREREQERRREADRICPQPVRPFVTARSGLRWTDPGNPWMADVIVEVEL